MQAQCRLPDINLFRAQGHAAHHSYLDQCSLIHLGHQKAKKANNTVFGLGLTDCLCRNLNLALANGSASPFSTLDMYRA
jgi:hypothetical protein